MKFITAFAATIASVSAAQFTWDIVTDQSVIGYKAYYGLSTNVMSTVAIQGRTNVLVDLKTMLKGTNYVYVTSVNDSGLESLPSNIVVYNNSNPPAPQNLVRQVIITVNIP